METCNIILTFESVDEILKCDHSNETSSSVLLHGTNGTTCQVLIFYKMKFVILHEFLCLAFLRVIENNERRVTNRKCFLLFSEMKFPNSRKNGVLKL